MNSKQCIDIVRRNYTGDRVKRILQVATEQALQSIADSRQDINQMFDMDNMTMSNGVYRVNSGIVEIDNAIVFDNKVLK